MKLAVLAVLTITSVAVAQENDARTRALSLFEEGVSAYDEGRFEEAAALFREANETFPEPILLYNYARAQESLGDLQSARDAYAEYLGSNPDNRAAVESRLQVLDEQLAERHRLEEQAERANDAPPVVERTERSTAGAVVLTIVSAASLAAGGGLIAAGQVKANNANDADRSLTSARDLHDQGQRLNRAGAILASVAGAALLAGILWLVRGGDDEADLALRF
ncbi:MAG: tetratricopeptide repeat protein [Myxococcota bacterium]